MIIPGYTQNSAGYGPDAIFLSDLTLDLDPSCKEVGEMTTKDLIQAKLLCYGQPPTLQTISPAS